MSINLFFYLKNNMYEHTCPPRLSSLSVPIPALIGPPQQCVCNTFLYDSYGDHKSRRRLSGKEWFFTNKIKGSYQLR